jgi:drug/metabolite transporter (DMT)-like permease
MPTRRAAIGLALLVTFLWSTSWVLIRFGLKEVPPLTFAGIRYFIAAVCLIPFLFTQKSRSAIRELKARKWWLLIAMGLIYYAVAQGTQYIGLVYLPLASASLLLNLTSLFVAGFGLILLHEFPTRLQWLGVMISLAGILAFFFPPAFTSQDWLGITIVMIGMLANSAGTIIGRQLNRSGQVPPIVVTAISMSLGAVLMLGSGLTFEGIPAISLASWGAILWMAVVNTAFAFTLWNYTQRSLQAMETSIINNTMTVQIAILGWLFSGEDLSFMEVIGILLVTIGTVLVQLRRIRLRQSKTKADLTVTE